MEEEEKEKLLTIQNIPIKIRDMEKSIAETDIILEELEERKKTIVALTLMDVFVETDAQTKKKLYTAVDIRSARVRQKCSENPNYKKISDERDRAKVDKFNKVAQRDYLIRLFEREMLKYSKYREDVSNDR